MRYNLAKFIVEQQLSTTDINTLSFDKIKEQEKDIPAIYSVTSDGLYLERFTMHAYDLGISIKAGYNKEIVFCIGIDGDLLPLTENPDLNAIFQWLETHQLNWEFDRYDTENKDIAIRINAQVVLLFNIVEGKVVFSQITTYNWDTYYRVVEAMKVK